MNELYIFLGIVVAILIYVLIFQLTAKFPIYPLGKYTFKKGIFTKMIVLLYDLSMRMIPKGIYYKIPARLQVPPIQLEGKTYYFFGNIGDFGYYSEKQIMKGKETDLYLVSWNYLNMDYLLIQYPSGKEEIWDTKLTLIQKFVDKNIYRVSPYIFHEEGKVRIKSSNRPKETTITIEVKGISY